MREIATFAYLMLTSNGMPNMPTGACTMSIGYVSILTISSRLSKKTMMEVDVENSGYNDAIVVGA